MRENPKVPKGLTNYDTKKELPSLCKQNLKKFQVYPITS
jgi:hypothetical protein